MNTVSAEKARAVRIEDELARRGFDFWTKPKHNNHGQPCPACGGRDRFRVSTTKQLFLCNQCGKSGDVIAIVQFLDGVGFLDAVKTLAGPEPSRNKSKPDPEARRRSEEKQKADEDKARAEENTRRLASLKMWSEAGPVDDTGLVARYLREERRISISPDDWAYLSPRVIRFHQRCPFGRDKDEKQLYFPAMVCLFRNVVDDTPQAIFRIALTLDGKKIDRLAYGSRGASSFAGLAAIKFFDDAEVDQGLVIAEGVETALAAAYGGSYRPVWAMTGTDGIKAFPVLPGLDGLTILAEKDKPGVTASIDAVRECGARWTQAGRDVIVWQSEFGDFNDAWREVAIG